MGQYRRLGERRSRRGIFHVSRQLPRADDHQAALGPRRRSGRRRAQGRLHARARRHSARRQWRKKILRGQFRAAAHQQARRQRRLSHRLLRAHHRRLARADRPVHRTALSPAAQSGRGRAAQARRRLPVEGRQSRPQGRPPKIVPYYDRGEIENGALDGWHLEICWLHDPVDVLFAQIQGSARIRLEDGTILRVNYDSHNGWPYTPIGRVLIDRKLIPKDEMSMQRIREWMDANPDQAKEVRAQNKSYVFFRITDLATEDEAVGAEGAPLVPGRSIAIDHALHVYGTPFFIAADLPIANEK